MFSLYQEGPPYSVDEMTDHDVYVNNEFSRRSAAGMYGMGDDPAPGDAGSFMSPAGSPPPGVISVAMPDGSSKYVDVNSYSVVQRLPGFTPTAITSPSQIPNIITAIGNGVSGGLTAAQTANLQAQLLLAARNKQPVYIPPSSPFGTMAWVVAGLALVVGAAVLLTGRSGKA